jgi:hypothetical protein
MFSSVVRRQADGKKSFRRGQFQGMGVELNLTVLLRVVSKTFSHGTRKTFARTAQPHPGTRVRVT